MTSSVTEWPVAELTVDERLVLLGRVWDSLLDTGAPPIQAWHLEEVRRRIAAADADPQGLIPVAESRRQLKGSRP